MIMVMSNMTDMTSWDDVLRRGGLAFVGDIIPLGRSK
jgi:hypothetical protein